ncbi:MAG: ribosome hibernation-promoting factor, HPF/YfiA family [Anaerolineae bacterium]
MAVELQARRFDLTPSIKGYVDKKVGRLDRYLPGIHATSVELARDSTRSQGEVYVAEITAWVDNAVLRAEEMNPDVFTAVDEAADKMYRQIEKYKGKRQSRWRGRAEKAPLPQEWSEPDAEGQPKVVRRKRFSVHAMGELEAAEQLELLGHDFFVFVDADSGQLNVLYRRHDGQFGVLVPVPA